MRVNGTKGEPPAKCDGATQEEEEEEEEEEEQEVVVLLSAVWPDSAGAPRSCSLKEVLVSPRDIPPAAEITWGTARAAGGSRCGVPAASRLAGSTGRAGTGRVYSGALLRAWPPDALL
ncbi:hypothetical protein E2C01_034726 [Portunus trituberculatus]|uniref:Uncharacterized protein n=1 Tax=Portunus trituberculatus TaxID=210409 RepID=A0A5B7F2A3_PORTR|nr:hypothetical protein [Portunus trituberculatus]